jgi:acetyl-CoA acetyltransferase
MRAASRAPSGERGTQQRSGRGIPESVPATTLDRQCGSSQQPVHFAAQGIMAGAYDVVIAAGVEVMSTTPMGSSKTPGSDVFGPAVRNRHSPQGGLVAQGISAEIVADRWNLSRQDLDEYGALSQQRAHRAVLESRFDNEILPVAAKRRDPTTGDVAEGGGLINRDEGIRPDTTAATVAALKPRFGLTEKSPRAPRRRSETALQHCSLPVRRPPNGSACGREHAFTRSPWPGSIPSSGSPVRSLPRTRR